MAGVGTGSTITGAGFVPAILNRASPWPGIVVCAALTWLAFVLHKYPAPPFTLSDDHHPLSAVLLALLFGLILRNLVPLIWQLRPGTDFVIKGVLPLGIVLLGAGLDFYTLLMLGMRVLAGAAFIISAVVKLTRISLPGPARLILGVVYARQRRKQEVYVGQRVSYARLIPAFVIFFLVLKTGGVRPFTLGLASTGIIAVLGLAYASLYRIAWLTACKRRPDMASH